jgi:hypothetical protein
VIDCFESALQKINRARKHADDLEAEVRTFWNTEPCEVEMIGGPPAGRNLYRVSRLAPLPESIPLIAGDAAHNIRSALDHFAWAAASPKERGAHTYYPVWNSAQTRTQDKWKKQVQRQMRGAPVQLIEAVTKLEAWETGRDSLLWAIHELDRLDKHRLLLSVAVALTGMSVDGDSYELTTVKKFSGIDPARPVALEFLTWTPVKDGTEFSCPDGAGFGATRTTLSFDVILGEPAMLRDRPAVTQLRILAGLAEKVVHDLAPLA